MRIPAKSIVSNSDMIRNYKTCREKAAVLGKLFIVKNNRLDAVLMPISEYEKLTEKANNLGVGNSSIGSEQKNDEEKPPEVIKYIELPRKGGS